MKSIFSLTPFGVIILSSLFILMALFGLGVSDGSDVGIQIGTLRANSGQDFWGFLNFFIIIIYFCYQYCYTTLG